jgi:hypothetical protein
MIDKTSFADYIENDSKNQHLVRLEFAFAVREMLMMHCISLYKKHRFYS